VRLKRPTRLRRNIKFQRAVALLPDELAMTLQGSHLRVA
jgi:hypothetical protein